MLYIEGLLQTAYTSYCCELVSIYFLEVVYLFAILVSLSVFCVLVTFNLESGGNNRWIKFNANMTGIYRVHYDDDNWQALIAQLKHDHSVSSLITLMLAFVASAQYVAVGNSA